MFSETGNNFSSVTTDNDETDSLNIQCKDIEVAKLKNPVNGINFPTVGRENDLSLCSSFHESNLNELCETINFTSVEIANDISVSDDCLKYECALDSAKIENKVQIDNTNDSKNPDQCQEPLKITSQSDRINGTLRKDEPILLSRNELESTLSNGCISQSNISDTRLELPKIQNGTVSNNNGEENDSSSKNSCDIHDQVKNDTENRSSVKRSATDEYSDSKNKRLKTEFTKFDEQLNPVKQESHPGESSLNGSSDFIDKKQIQNPNKLYQGLLNDLLAEEKDVVKEPEVIRNKLKRIKRKDLEDMIIDQVVHKLLYDHEIGYQRDVCKRVEQTMDGAKDRAAKLSQEIENLQSIVAKVSLEHRKRKSHLVFPTKVKRSVGVQVNKSYISQAFSATSSPESDGEFLTPTKFQRPKKDGHKPLSKNGKKPKHKLKEALEESPTKEKYFDLGKNFDKKLNSLKEDLKKNISEDKCSPRANVGKSPKKSVVNGALKREGQRNKQKKNVEMVHKMVGSHKSTCTIPEEPETGHPAPLPSSTLDEEDVLMNRIPPEPILRVHLRNKSIILSWNINVPYDETSILSYQLFSYEETKSPPSTDLWQKIGSVKALELPMACTLTQFKCGRVYHFAVRAMTKKGRLGPFSQAKGLRMPAK